jgi:hypothetical protein
VSSTHGEQQTARRAYLRIAHFFAGLRAKAEQLDTVQRWYRILSEALRKYLRGRQLIPSARLQPGGPARYGCNPGRKLPPCPASTAGFRIITSINNTVGDNTALHAELVDILKSRLASPTVLSPLSGAISTITTSIVRIGGGLVGIFLIQLVVGFARYYYKLAEHQRCCEMSINLSAGRVRLIPLSQGAAYYV